jgi:CubicO group peptidase (beta-lactamase class C family)
MLNHRAVALIGLALLIPAQPATAQPSNPEVDRIFSQWDRAGSPGCALGVVKDGAIAYARGYGLANLEDGSPITTGTVFDIGSVSKQFTAMSIVLLAQDGRLSLDDDIHATVPELPDYGARVSLRQMLHHLSGLPSYTDLFDLAGVPETNLTTDADALALIARQGRLNFVPGERYLYSDTNYFLLALVVRRVSGESLRSFAQRRIFGPLGMRSTHFHDDHALIVPHRATGYAPRAGGGFAIDMSNFEELGDGSVMTTVDDMVRWDRNFRAARVGGRAAIAQLEELGVRADGTATPYAMGQIRDTYRGFDRVQHTGEWVGYRAGYLRFPGQGLSVILLCNSVGALDALGLAEQVADLFLPAAPRARRPAATGMDRFAGRYWNERSFATLRFESRAGALALVDDDAVLPLAPSGAATFEAGNSRTRFVFHEAGAGMQVQAFNDDGDPEVLERVPTSAPTATLGGQAGTYYSEDLGVTWQLAIDGGHLVRHQWLFPAQTLRPQFGDVFQGDLSEGSYTLRFTRTGGGDIDGFAVATGMVRPLRFIRCEPADPRARGPMGVGCKPLR